MGSDFLDVMIGVFGSFAKIFIDVWEHMAPPIKELLELLKEIKSIVKIKYDPVKEIKPNKVILINKRFNMYYCRNNC